MVPTCTFIQEVSEQAAHDRLVADDQHVLLPLQLHDDRLHPLHQVLVGLEAQAVGTSQTRTRTVCVSVCVRVCTSPAG